MQLPDNLVDVDWLKNNLSAEKLQLFDASMAEVGSKTAYVAKEIIPTAKRFDFSHHICDLNSKLSNALPDAATFTNMMQQFGIDQDSAVVVYDQKGLYSAARAWWMFKIMGFNNVAILNGGLPAWLAAQYDVCDVYASSPKQGNFMAQFNAQLVVDAQAVLSASADGTAQILDARSAERFFAKRAEPRALSRAGHIPNAKNLHYASLIDNGFLKPKLMLEKLFCQLTDNKQQNLIFSCGSGVTACILILAATQCGYTHLALYDGSWNEWGMDKLLPVSTT